ncbi:hypothetical protein H0X10_00995 [Candidatus Saccharibacteria bacterium]|nr:hypothetical protein [Candidatus Saccharibacteria bacterium]
MNRLPKLVRVFFIGAGLAMILTLLQSPQKASANTLPSTYDVPMIPCGDGTFTRYVNYITSPDLVDEGGGNFSVATAINQITFNTYAASNYACPTVNPATRGPAYLHHEDFIFNGSQTISGGAASANSTWGYRGSSGWQFTRSFTVTLNPGVNTLNLRLAGDTCTAVNSNPCSNYPITGISNNVVRITFNQDRASCTITAPNTLSPGQSFSASFTATNAGGVVWSVHPTNTNRWRLGKSNPRTFPANNGTWGTTRVEIPGYPGLGLVVYPGQTSPSSSSTPTTFTQSFTAPTTPGTYNFDWEVVRENVYWVGSPCSKSIIVATATPTLSCNGTPNSVAINTNVTFSVDSTSTATGPVAWGGMLGANSSPGTGTSFITTYPTTGTKTVDVTRQGVPDSCSVNVTATPPTSGGLRRLGPWDSITNLPPVL